MTKIIIIVANLTDASHKQRRRPMTRIEYLLFAMFFAVSILGLSQFHDYLNARTAPQVVLKSLPLTKVPCADDQIKGHCTQFNISTKEWESMQK